MTTTAIEWATDVWNPTTGCDRVSPGCDRCYALTMARRLKGMGSAKYQRDGDPRTSGPGFGITEHATALDAPLHWRKPRRIFVNSMSDLFHDGVSEEFLARVWAVMAVTPHHTYQVLTKRHGRMRSLLNYQGFIDEVAMEAVAGNVEDGWPMVPVEPGIPWWPLRNVWVGVSVEDQKRADLRIPALLDTTAAVRFLSCEPLLGPVDLAPWVDQLGWVIAGGESGPGARPMHPAWPRKLRDQCIAAGVPFHFKQWGQYGLLPRGWREEGPWPYDPGVTVADDGTVYQPGDLTYDPPGPRYGEAVRAGRHRARLTGMHRVGKKEAGRELDGRTWDEFPRDGGTGMTPREEAS